MHESIFNNKITLSTVSGLSSIKVDIVRTEYGIEIRLIDVSNIFSLWIYSLSSSDFYVLKKEQDILVDYDRFIQILVNLFHGVTINKYSASFNDGVLRFIENSEFRNICKLELKFTKPEESQFKRYLGDLIARMEGDNIKLIKENSILRDRCLNGDQVLKEKTRYLENENSEIKRRIDLLKRDFNIVEEAKQSKEDEISRLSSRMFNLENENSQLRYELEKYQKDNSASYKEQVKIKEEEVEVLSKEVETANNIIKRLRNENSELKQFKTEMEYNTTTEKDRNIELTTKLEEINKKYNNLEGKYKKAKEEAKEKNLRIEDLQESNRSLTKKLENAQNVYNHFYLRKMEDNVDNLSDTMSFRPESPPPR